MPSIDPSARDHSVIEHMLQYCDQLQETLKEIDCDESRFLASHTYQNGSHVYSAIGRIDQTTVQRIYRRASRNSLARDGSNAGSVRTPLRRDRFFAGVDHGDPGYTGDPAFLRSVPG